MSEMLFGVPFDYEPKRENRFFLEFPSELGIEVWTISSFKKPSLRINSVEIPYLNAKYYVSGQYNWDEMDITLIDIIGPSTSQKVMEWVRLHAESMTARMGYNSGASKDLVLKVLDPTGVPVEQWKIERCIITSVDFGNQSQDSDEVSKITITVQPQRCILQY